MKRKEFLGTIGAGLLGGAAFLSGCTKLLNQINPNSLTPNNFWKTASDAEANLTAVYESFLGTSGWGAAADNWYNRWVPALYRGDDIGITHDVPDWWSLALFTFSSSNGEPSGNWNMNYTGIFRANQVIEYVPGINMDTTLRARYIGEAKFLRAYYYFNLLTNFMNIPLITSVSQVTKDNAQPQAKPSDVWAQIEKDLTDAVAVLPATYDAADQGRVTKGAALAYLGKTQLYQKKWGAAAATFQQIIDSKTYSLMPNYFDIFTNDFNQEDILEVNYAGGTFKGQAIKNVRTREEGPSEAGGWYECFPNQWLINEFMKEKQTNGDLDGRMYGSIIWPNNPQLFYGDTYTQLFGAGATKTAWRKYNDSYMSNLIQDYGDKNDKVVRYADVLLMQAEALVQSGGSTSDALKYINMVRGRAGLSDFTGTAKTDILNEIEHQRVLELSDECIRWYDLWRWNGNITGTMNIKQALKAHGAIGADNFVIGTHELLPIPISEMQTNPKMKQNPGF